MLSITLPYPWEDEGGELVLHFLEECSSADRVEFIGKVQGDQCPVWMVFIQEVSDSIHYILSTSCHAHIKLYREEFARELFLEVAHDGRADELVEDGPYGNGSYSLPFLVMGISLA